MFCGVPDGCRRGKWVFSGHFGKGEQRWMVVPGGNRGGVASNGSFWPYIGGE